MKNKNGFYLNFSPNNAASSCMSGSRRAPARKWASRARRRWPAEYALRSAALRFPPPWPDFCFPPVLERAKRVLSGL
jgi:hypothetical protein